MIYTLFLVLILLAAVLMIGIVLIQESKGGGLASNFSSSNAIMGVRKTTDRYHGCPQDYRLHREGDMGSRYRYGSLQHRMRLDRATG